jgi:hypothetical protein
MVALPSLPFKIPMVSGLKGDSYEEKLLGKRWHQADMIQTFKIVRWIDGVDYM